MTAIALDEIRFIRSADVYKNGIRAGRLTRKADGAAEFAYLSDYLASAHARAIASTLPLSDVPVVAAGGGVPPFFAGLLPEGRRLTLLREAVKTSLDDEFALLLAVGEDVPGDVSVYPEGTEPRERGGSVDAGALTELDFRSMLDTVDRHGLPGVQDKLSSQMISGPIATRGGRFILKLSPDRYPRLVQNEHLHLTAASSLGLPVAESTLVTDARGAAGLLVTRFDRIRDSTGWSRLPLEDATQVLGLPPAAKYVIDSEAVVGALSALCGAPLIAVRNLYLQFVFAWLTGNGDLHGKNVAVLGGVDDQARVAPIYDIPCTLLYGDDTMALPVAGKTKNLRGRHWLAFAESIGLPKKAAASANTLALAAASRIDLGSVGLAGSPLNGAVRELRLRRAELSP